MRIVISFRQILKDKLSEDKYDFLARNTDEQGGAYAFIQEHADLVKNIPDDKFRSFVKECDQLYQAGFHGSRWNEMELILARYIK